MFFSIICFTELENRFAFRHFPATVPRTAPATNRRKIGAFSAVTTPFQLLYRVFALASVGSSAVQKFAEYP